jgi:hypothetical protein
MSATLTWYNSGLGTKTGTAIGNYFTDMKTLMDSKSADSNFKWEVAASSLAGTPYYLWIRRKDGSNGRILLISWTSAPAGNNAAILDTAPTTNVIYAAWFPNGTAASPSNLTAASGSISGDDTNCVRCAPCAQVSIMYTTNYQPYYFECQEGIFFGTGYVAGSASYMLGVGDLVVDSSDVAYGCTLGYFTGQCTSFFAASSTAMPWLAAGVLAGAGNAPYIKTNYLSQSLDTNTVSFYHAFSCNGQWFSQVNGSSNDPLTDVSSTDVWFLPMQLIANGARKGLGFPLKLRQIAIGPTASSSFMIYNTTGPVVQARCFNPSSSATTGNPWFVNFKI